ncbi:hypothetical protein ANO11243_021370 [Dothideomycetidae sp. 11243]|nr:hypothetical protein ANO11243_021370 [fungal sp. No.11243]
MPSFVGKLLNHLESHMDSPIKVREDAETVQAISRFVDGHDSETTIAILRQGRAAKHKHRLTTRTPIRNVSKDIKLVMRTKRERSRRTSKPSALRELVIAFPARVRKSTAIPTVQLVPRRRHASSGFPYPEWLEQYGVTREEWKMFISRIQKANGVRPRQLALMAAFFLVFDLLVFAPWPDKILSLPALTAFPLYQYVKRRNLRNQVKNGHIPIWTATWNMTYFGPKGLCVGFDLPGPVFPQAFVHPKQKPFRWMRLYGSLRKPMSSTQAARRARITIARVHDPIADAGRVPNIDPLPVRRAQKLLTRLGARPKRYIARLERKVDDREALVASMRARRERYEAALEEAETIRPRVELRRRLEAAEASASCTSPEPSDFSVEATLAEAEVMHLRLEEPDRNDEAAGTAIDAPDASHSHSISSTRAVRHGGYDGAASTDPNEEGTTANSLEVVNGSAEDGGAYPGAEFDTFIRDDAARRRQRRKQRAKSGLHALHAVMSLTHCIAKLAGVA